MAKAKKTEVHPDTVTETTKLHFQEWEVKVLSGGKYDKMRISRPVVKITQEQADILNESVLYGGNTYAAMYFLPE